MDPGLGLPQSPFDVTQRLGLEQIYTGVNILPRLSNQQWLEVSDLQKSIVSQRNLGHDWDLSPQQEQVLRQYYGANQFLVDCLNSDCSATPVVRKAIVSRLLLAES